MIKNNGFHNRHSPISRFTPANLFAAGEQGVWYDPSDLTTMFQDAAGTTPVTGVEQPVGRILDKSGRGNHATQSTTTSRPVLSARYNLLTRSEEFDNAAWTKSGLSVSANAVLAPDGSLTADTISDGVSTGIHYVYFIIATTASTNYTFSAFYKDVDRRYIRHSFVTAYSWNAIYADVDLQSGTIINQGQVGGGILVGASITAVGNGWYRVSVSGSLNSGGTYCVSTLRDASTNVTTEAAQHYTGSNKMVHVWGAQLIPTNALPSNAYQRVTTATDYDSNPALFPYYLAFDGTDDWLQTGPINFTSTDKMTVVAGVRKLSDATVAMLAELSASVVGNNGTFYLAAPVVGGSPDYQYASKGTAATSATASPFAAPITNVVSALSSIGAPSIVVRVNGTQAASATTTQGTGTYGNYPLFIGRRAGTSLPFNGHLYGLIVRGAASSASQISAAERFIAQKTGVTL